MQFFKQLFTWWNSQTFGTMLYTWRNGRLVGSDDKGNLFYESKSSNRRWVIFKNDIDASTVSAEWHGWLHHTVLMTPDQKKTFRNSWEKPHLSNKTGSVLAYHPLGENRIKRVNYNDFQAWSPNDEK